MDTIGFDSAASEKSASADVSVDLTIADGRHRILIAFLMFYNWLVSSRFVRFNGVDMTEIGGNIDVGNERSLHAYYLLDPPVGTYTLLGSWGSAIQGAIAGLSFSGVSRLKPPYFEQLGNAGSTTLTTDTPTAGSMVVDAVWKSVSGTTITCGGSQTERFREVNSSGSTYHFVGSTRPKDGATTDMYWNFSTARLYLHTALVLNPAPMGARFRII